MVKNNKRIAVLFSGGLDSTYLMYKNMKDGNSVVPIYITLENNYNKVEIEKENAQKVLDELKSHLNINVWLVDALNLKVNECSNSVMLKQLPAWILGALYSANCDSYDEIHIGYVNGDSSIPYISDITKIWKSYASICHYKQPKLKFPIAKLTKKELWDNLPDNIRQLTYFCENPKDKKDCGECQSCKRYKYEDLYYLYDRHQSENGEVKTLDYDLMVTPITSKKKRKKIISK